MFFLSLAFAAIIQSATVAQVGGQVITSREVAVSIYINEARALPKEISIKEKRKRINKISIPEMGSSEFISSLSQVIIEHILQLEAESFSVGVVDEEKLKEELVAVQNAVKEVKSWQNLQVSDKELFLVLNRKARAQNFLKFKMDSSGLQITDDEARSYYEKNRVKFGSASFVQFKDSIKQLIAQQVMQEKLKDWFEVLKRKYSVRFLKPSEVTEKSK